MNEKSENEIIDTLKNFEEGDLDYTWTTEDYRKKIVKAIRTILDLYQQKKKQLERLSSEFAIGKRQYGQLVDELSNNYIGKDKVREVRDKAELMDYYCLVDVIKDLTKLIGDEDPDE